MGNLSIGLELMLVGMLTVFAILLIVIYGGRLLILIANKLFPEAAAAAKAAGSDNIPMDVIRAAVEQITGGKGRVAGCRKIE